ncbi:MAG: RsmB/NOP family class I SAM-dependent RNA methyltransferase [Rhodospirillaceae bacterium]|nr:RsmB/NOP family class I SAM-dependent RNA methyltransferase [Rhodospirillaceae bacterium]
MTPASRIQAVIEVLDEVLATDRAADGVISAYFRPRRYIGAGDRRAISDQLWRILRHRARLTWALGTDHPSGRLFVAANLVRGEGKSVDAIAGLFSGAKNGPSPLAANEKRMAERVAERPAGRDDSAMPREVRLECPWWLLEKFDAAFGAEADLELAALDSEAALDLRVNTLKASRDDVLAKFKAEEQAAAATPLSPLGIRLPARISLGDHAGFRDGLFEVQDEASQLCAQLVDARPGQTVMDFCAGAGGKTLAMAAAMENKGRLIACDVSIGRLERSKLRLRRSGVHNATLRILEDNDKWVRRQAGSFDRVLVDAPCSGTGAWRRNPDARWHLKPENLESLRATQDNVLDQGAPLVKLGGRLIYATCSLLPEENTQRVEAFLARHPGFRPMPMAEVWAGVLSTACPTAENFLTLTPFRHGSDGFFVAVLERIT